MSAAKRLPRPSRLSLECVAPAVAGVFLIGLLAWFGGVREQLYSNADNASAPVLAEAMGHPGARTILIGDSPWYEPLWFLRATSWLPSHAFIWQVLPFIAWLIGVGLLYAIVRRATGERGPALVGAALFAAPGLGMRGIVWAPNVHGLAITHVLLLLLGLVVALTDQRWLHGRRAAIGVIALGLISALGATDPLVLLYGVVPLLAAAVFVGVRGGGWSLMRAAGAVALITFVGGRLLVKLGEHAGIHTSGRIFNFVDVTKLPEQLAMLPEGIVHLASSTKAGTPIDLVSGLIFGGGLLALFAFGIVLRAGLPLVGSTVRQVAADRPDAATDEPERDPKARRTATDGAAGPPVVEVVVLFATVAVLVALVVWCLTGLVFDLGAIRYIAPAYLAVCAAVPIAATHYGWRTLSAIGAAAIVVAATLEFNDDHATRPVQPAPTERDASVIREFAAAHGVTRGYGAYWSALPVTWHTRFKLRLAPVLACGDRNCPYMLAQSSDWYAPRGGPTMLLTDSQTPNQPTIDGLYGEPIATLRHGIYTARIYPTDIAEHLG